MKLRAVVTGADGSEVERDDVIQVDLATKGGFIAEGWLRIHTARGAPFTATWSHGTWTRLVVEVVPEVPAARTT